MVSKVNETYKRNELDILSYNDLMLLSNETSSIIRRYFYAIGFSLSRNIHDADNIANEAFIKALKGRSTFDSDKTVAPWLIKVGYNAGKDYMRVKRRREEGSTRSKNKKPKVFSSNRLTPSYSDGSSFEIVDIFDNTVDKNGIKPIGKALQEERDEYLYRAIDSLPTNQRALIISIDILGKSYNHVSRMLSIPLGTVKSGLNSARKALKQRLEETGYFSGPLDALVN